MLSQRVRRTRSLQTAWCAGGGGGGVESKTVQERKGPGGTGSSKVALMLASFLAGFGVWFL